MLSLSKQGHSHRALFTALALSAIAGWGDAAGYLMLGGVFTSHISGNSIDVGVRFATHAVHDALHHLGAIVLFFFGVALGVTLIELVEMRFKKRVFGIMLALEALLIVCFFAVAVHREWWILVFPSLAFGVQNATLRRAGHHKLRTTYVSGMLTNCAQNFVEAFFAFLKRDAEYSRKRADAFFYGSIWLCFALGGIAGAMVQVHAGRFSLLGPIAALALLSAADLIFPAD